jgi:CheY-like chemotaxis protein
MVKNKILIVEDEKITAMDLKFKLEDLGYEVCGMAVNGNDAINLALEKKPNLVLMDITLKGEMNGINAAKSILNENIPLIFLTSHTDENTFKEANLVPSYGFLNKPFDMMKLERTIKLAINRSKIELDKIHIAKGEKSVLTEEDKKLHEQALREYEAGKKFKNDFLTKKSNNTNKKYSVLVVEDEAITALDIQDKLESFGYTVLASEGNGEKAIQLAKEERPDLILMDISLKGSLSGIEVSKEIDTLNIPIIFLTANTNNENVEDALETAPYGFITKPIFDTELQQLIELVIIKHNDDFQKILNIEGSDVNLSTTTEQSDDEDTGEEPKFKSLIRGILKK